MRIVSVFAAAAGLVLAAPPSLAQDTAARDEFKIGPVPVQQEFQGARVSMPVNVYLNLKTTPERVTFRARAYGDLSDLQAKVDRMMKDVPLPRDNCASYSSDNIVAEIKKAKLTAAGDTAVLHVDGRAEVWSCVENILQDVKIEWKVRKLCCGIKTKVPVRVTVRRSSPIKTRLVSQSFSAKIPARIVRPTPNEVGIAVDRLDVSLNGDLAKVLQAGLFYGGVDLNTIGQKMINKTLRPNTIPLLVPDDFKIFNPVLERAVFVGADDKLKVEVVLSGGLEQGQTPDVMKALAAGRPAD